MNLTQDQSRFLQANVAGLSLALPYQLVPRSIRNEYNFLPGILIVYYCFGRQANSLVLFSVVSYAICRFVPQRYVQRATLCTSLAFLSYAHLSRQIMDYGGYILDISGPFMIAVQKITSLGFCLYDGHRVKEEKKFDNQQPSSEINNDNNNNTGNGTRNSEDNQDDDTIVKSPKSLESSDSIIASTSTFNEPLSKKIDVKLTKEQENYAVINPPSFKEFMGYFFHFPSVLCGPIMYFTDYKNFVDAPSNRKLPPGRHWAVVGKLGFSITCAILHLSLNPKFEVEFLRSKEFLIHTPLLIRFYYILIFTMLSRLKYYVAWHLGEAISNLSGLGFNGYTSDGKPKWNLISNMDILKFETSLNLREAIHAWNKSTQGWLRRTAYERAPRKFSVLATYMLSALWHGFYPGYYMTFLGGALFTHASRNGRRIIRPIFQRGIVLPKVYDVITFILTRLTIAYAAFPFVILDLRNNLAIYSSLYFSIHILAVAGVVLGFVSF